MTDTKPLTIVLTGINGAGKDTHAEPLAEFLDGVFGLPAQAVYAPKIVPAAAAFRSVVLDVGTDSLLAELLGYNAQHAASAHYLSGLQREQPQHLVINRGPETAFVYNAVANELTGDQYHLAALALEVITNILNPTLTILLDVELETARRRMAKQAETDHIQERGDSYYYRMNVAYRQLAAGRSGWASVDANVDDPGEVFERIKHVVRPLLERKPA